MTYINSGGRTTWVPSPKAQITKKYHVKDTQYAAGYHTGLDIAVEGSSGQKIVWAPKVKGKVVKSGMDPNGYGHYVIIESDNNRQWLLAHMKDAGPKVGTILMQGDKIGNIGASGHVSGPHLHIEEGKKGSDWQYAVGKNPKIGFTPNNPNMHSPNGHTIAALSFGGGMQQTSASELNMLAGATGGAEENLSTKVGGVGKQHNSDNPAQTVKGSYKQNNPKKGVDELKITGNGNGDNIQTMFNKTFGAEAGTAMQKTIENMKAAGSADFKEIGKPGQYGYTIAVKTKDGWSTDPKLVKDKLVQFVPSSSDSQQDAFNKLKLLGATSGGTEKNLSGRFGRAFDGGDVAQGNTKLVQSFTAYKEKYPGKIKVVGELGKPGAYIMVKVNGQWTSNSDIVAKELSILVKTDTTKSSNKSAGLTKVQKDYLGGANGMSVLENYKRAYGGDSAKATDNLKIAIKAYEKSNPGNDIRVFGKVGQPGFYIEVKTQNGWVNGTQTVLNKLDRYMPKTSPIATAPSASGGVTESAFAPGATGPNQSAPSDSSTGSLPSEQANSQNPTTNSENPTDPGVVGLGETVGPEIGLEAGSQEFNQFDDRLRQWAGDRQQEKDSFNPNSSKNGAVDLGKAARKSEAMMAFDLDGSGDISAAEKALMANGDQNNNGIVGEYGLKKFVAQADTNNSGLVSQAEVKAYNVVDTNNNNKLSAREIKAYGNVDANNDGDITKKEAKAMVKDLRAQVDLSKQEKKDLDLAKQYLAKSNGKSGGADNVDAQVAALVNSQPKHDKKGDTGPKGATKKNK
jgi:hypothetical protein